MLLVDYLRGSFRFSADGLGVEVSKTNTLLGLSRYLAECCRQREEARDEE